MQKKAFTLIELLVAIAIIAILAAILYPVFAQAKYAAKQTFRRNKAFVNLLGEHAKLLGSMAGSILRAALEEIDRLIQVALASLLREIRLIWQAQERPSVLFTNKYLIGCTIA